MARRLPDPEEAARILKSRRTRPPRRAPPPASRAIARALKPLDGRFAGGEEGLAARWTEIVGRDLARGVRPGRLIRSKVKSGALLELRVDGPGAVLIQHRSAEIIARVNLFLGRGAVTGVRVSQAPRRGAPEPMVQRSAPKRDIRGPLDAADEAHLVEGLAAVPDGELKRALSRLGREVMRRAPRGSNLP